MSHEGAPRLQVVDAPTGVRLVIRESLRVTDLIDLRDAAVALVDRATDVELDLTAAGHLHAGAVQILIALRATVEATRHRFTLGAIAPGAHAALSFAGLSRWSGDCT